MNVKLLKRIKEQILAEPAQFVMSTYFSDNVLENDIPRKIPNCGTAACIAGWACTLDLKITPALASKQAHVQDKAESLLKLYRGQAERLFLVSYWPEPFCSQSAHRASAAELDALFASLQHSVFQREP